MDNYMKEMFAVFKPPSLQYFPADWADWDYPYTR